jgi:hypothetical protein
LKSAGVVAQVLNAAGQYPGLLKASPREPLRDAWVVYVGPSTTEGQAEALCRSEAVRKVRSSAACLTYEPAKG